MARQHEAVACLCAGLREPPRGADGQTGARGPMLRSGEAPVGGRGLTGGDWLQATE